MKQDKQTENDARLFFDDILQKTNFIEKLRSVTREVRDKLSQFDPRKTEKITYSNFPVQNRRKALCDKG